MSTKGTRIPEWLTVPFAGITPAPTQEKGQDLFPTGNWRSIRPVYRDKLPPCNNACGTNEKIQGYLDLVKRGKYLDAYALIKEDMPFPSLPGACVTTRARRPANRGQYDEAISIRAVERFLGDLGSFLGRHWFQRQDVQFVQRHFESLLIRNHRLNRGHLDDARRLHHGRNQRSRDIRRDRFAALGSAFR